MVKKVMNIEFKFERTGQVVSDFVNPEFPRQDTVRLIGTIYGDDLTGLAIKASLKVLPQDVVIASKDNTSGVTITDVNANIKKVQIDIAAPADTEAFEGGQQFVFDIQTTIGTDPDLFVRTHKGRFKISEDYTVTVP